MIEKIMRALGRSASTPDATTRAPRTRTVYRWRCSCGAHSRGTVGSWLDEYGATGAAEQHGLRSAVGHSTPHVYAVTEERPTQATRTLNGASRSRGRIELEPALVAPPGWGFSLDDADRRRPLMVLNRQDLRGQLRQSVDAVAWVSRALGYMIDRHAAHSAHRDAIASTADARTRSTIGLRGEVLMQRSADVVQ